jgi:hypothetical protein
MREKGGPYLGRSGITMIGKTETPATQYFEDFTELVRLELVRLRAYDLYERRGKEDGHDLDDWLQAESEIVRTKATAVGA